MKKVCLFLPSVRLKIYFQAYRKQAAFKAVCFLFVAEFILPRTLLAQYANIRLSSEESTSPEEVTIAINPVNPLNLAAGANINFYYYSTDGGLTWNEGNLFSTLGAAGDPCVIFDAQGNLYYAHLSYPSEGYWLDRIVVQKSVDGGITWNDGAGVGLNPPKQQDKEWLAADRTDSPFRNNLYLAWTEFDRYGSANPTDSSRILFARSTDFAETWSAPVRVSDRAGDSRDSDGTVEGAVPAIGPNGEIYLSWSGPEEGIYFDKSLDGGLTFGKDVLVTTQPGGWDFNVSGISRSSGFPVTACDISQSPYRGTIYIMWSDQRNGLDNTDIFLVKSTDGGVSWSEVKKVNTDTTGRQQFFPWMAVDPVSGNLYIVFYDRRNTTGDATDVYVARSADGGESFTNFKVSQSSFIPRTNIFFGDYINIAAWNWKVYPIWMRMDDGNLSVWTAPIADTLTGIMAEARKVVPGDFRLWQNFPNPFNAQTTIQYQVAKLSQVRLKIFNTFGQEIRRLVETSKKPGIYKVVWDGRDGWGKIVASGVYLLKFEREDFVQMKKMVVIR